MPWKEFVDLAYWHDSLNKDIEQYENMAEEEFHRIEAKAAYSQYIILSHIAKKNYEI